MRLPIVLLSVLALLLLGLWAVLRTPDNEIALPVEVTASNELGEGGLLDAHGLDATEQEPEPRQVVSPEHQASESEASDAGVSLIGRVVGPEGSPVAEATVLLAYQDEWVDGSLDVDLVPGDGDDKRRTKLSTDSGGAFRQDGLRDGPMLVAARADGFAPLDLPRLFLPDHGLFDLGDLRLDAGLILEGVVVDADGVGVSGARLSREDRRDEAGSMLRFGKTRHVPLTTSDEEGKFRIGTLTPGRWKLRVESPDHPVAWFEGVTFEPDLSDGHVFQLEDSWSITGRLVIPGVTDYSPYSVALKYADDPDALPDLRYEHRLMRMDCAADGAFEFTSVRAVDATTRYTLQAWRVSGPQVRNVGDALEVTAGDRDVVLTGEPLAGLRFNLVAAESYEPIGDPVVYLVIFGGNHVNLTERGSVEQTEPGRFRVPDITRASESETFSLHIQKEGYRGLFRSHLGLAPGTERDLGVLELEPASYLTVRVTDAETGEPIANAEVHRESREAPYFLQVVGSSEVLHFDSKQVTARTDSEGVARVSLVKGYSNVVGAAHPDYAVSLAPSIDGIQSAPSQIDLEMGRGASVQVRVEDKDGGPISGEDVRCTSIDLGEELRGLLRFIGHEARFQETDVKGEVRFLHVAPGRTLVGLPFRAPEGNGETLLLDHGDEHQITLVVPSRTDLEVTVRESGRALVGAEIALYVAGETDDEGALVPPWYRYPVAADKTGSSGQALLEGIESGFYEIAVQHETRSLATFYECRVELDAAPIVIDLVLSSVAGRVVSEDGAPCENASVFVLHEAYGTRESLSTLLDNAANVPYGPGMTHTDEEGRFELRGLPSGSRLLVAAAPPGSRLVLCEPFSLGGDERHFLADLVAEAAGSLQVSLRLPEDRQGAHRGYAVQLDPLDLASRSGQRDASFDREGRSSIDHLAPGEWRLRLVSRFSFGGGGQEQESFHEQTVVIRAGETTEIELDVPR